MDLDAGAFRDDEVELGVAGEVADAGVADAGGLVRRDDVVPRAHLRRRRWRRRVLVLGSGREIGRAHV